MMTTVDVFFLRSWSLCLFSSALEDSSDDDEPLIKMIKKEPSDEQLKETVKNLLKDANLEEMTMKQICQRVRARGPQLLTDALCLSCVLTLCWAKGGSEREVTCLPLSPITVCVFFFTSYFSDTVDVFRSLTTSQTTT